MVFITYKVLNQLHSDTIACVLYELLVCQFSWLWNCLSWFSITFKVPQVSVLFNFQGPACSPLGQLNHYIKGRTFCQALFRYFFEPSKRLFRSFPPARCPVPRRVFAGASLLFGFWRAAVLRDSLFIIPHFYPKSTPFFDFLHNFFDLFLDKVYSVVLAHFLVSIPSPTKNICFLLFYIIV